jgi:hypothetical protein
MGIRDFNFREHEVEENGEPDVVYCAPFSFVAWFESSIRFAQVFRLIKSSLPYLEWHERPGIYRARLNLGLATAEGNTAEKKLRSKSPELSVRRQEVG